jgi:acetyltransferase-like isoleucine patch superfamily enzyme
MISPKTHEESRIAFRRFLHGETGERIFAALTCHPSQPTGFCPCDGPFLETLRFYIKAWLLLTVLKLAWNGPKLKLLRWCGAQVGRNVFISSDVWIDPAFPQLLTIEDDVMIGVGVKIALHEFRPREFRAGRVIIRKGAVIGGFALIGHGVEIGEGAVVAGGAAVGRNVPAGKLAIGNPARVMPLGAPASLPASWSCEETAGRDAGAPSKGVSSHA